MCKATQPTETRGCPEAGTKRTLALLQLSSELDGILTPQSRKCFQSHTTVVMPLMCQSRNGHLGTGCWCLNIDGRRHAAFLQHPSRFTEAPISGQILLPAAAAQALEGLPSSTWSRSRLAAAQELGTSSITHARMHRATSSRRLTLLAPNRNFIWINYLIFSLLP